MVYHILGNGGYPIMKWLLTPFRNNGHLSRPQQKYNHYHSSNRVVIERVFALLKTRFRRLHYVDTAKVSTAVDVIMACCILYNFCIKMMSSTSACHKRQMTTMTTLLSVSGPKCRRCFERDAIVRNLV